MRKNILFLTVVCILFSCDSEEDTMCFEESPNNVIPHYAISNDDNSVTDVDFTSFYGYNSMTRSSEVSGTYSATDQVVMKGTGYTKASTIAFNNKCQYSSSSPLVRSLGLAGGIYIVDLVMVTKTLSTYNAGDLIIPISPDESKKDMGLVDAGCYSTNLGWKGDEVIENGDKTFIGTTYLVYVKNTLGGATINKYYPCSPDKLVWNYNSVKY